MTIYNRQYFHTLTTLGFTNLLAATLGRGKRGVDEALALVDVALIAQRVGQIGQDLAQHLALAPLLEAAMHRLVVGVTLRQQVPLRTRVQNPEYRLQHLAGR